MSHTGLVSLPVPVVGQQNSTLLHVPVVPLVLASRARVVVGTGFPLVRPAVLYQPVQRQSRSRDALE